MRLKASLVFAAILAVAAAAWADPVPERTAPRWRPAPPTVAPVDVQFPIDEVVGPAAGRLGTHATLQIPAGMRFLEKPESIRRFLEESENVYNPSYLGILLPPRDGTSKWWVVFQFQPLGYVRDEDKERLDGNTILEALKQGTQNGNVARKARGWEAFDVVGWHTPPRYDDHAKRLDWATLVSSPKGQSVNYEVRLLGRLGVMSALLVEDPDAIETSIPALRAALAGFAYVPGEDYAAYQSGDKVATQTVANLIAGPAPARSSMAFYIAAGIVALGLVARRLFTRRKS